MAKPGIYDLNAVTLTIGGQLISGYAEDGGIEYEGEPIMQSTVGAAGEVAFSRLGNRNKVVTVTVMETSVSYQILGGLLQAQQALLKSSLPLVPLNYLMLDPRNGDSIGALYAIFMERPNMNKGATAGERVFVIELVNPTEVYGALNVV